MVRVVGWLRRKPGHPRRRARTGHPGRSYVRRNERQPTQKRGAVLLSMVTKGHCWSRRRLSPWTGTWTGVREFPVLSVHSRAEGRSIVAGQARAATERASLIRWFRARPPGAPPGVSRSLLVGRGPVRGPGHVRRSSRSVVPPTCLDYGAVTRAVACRAFSAVSSACAARQAPTPSPDRSRSCSSGSSPRSARTA
jgi:hypothetical protein